MSDGEEEKPNIYDAKLRMSKNVTLAVKLNGTNYPLWKRLMRVAIVGRRAGRYITGIPPPPEPGMKGYAEWEEADMIVFSWIIDNVEIEIVVDFAHHKTAQALWESLLVTFESTTDPYLLYDLEQRAGQIVQGEQELETYWRHLHGIWVEIDRCQHQPVDCCDKGINQFRRYRGTRRLFKFLRGLNARYEVIRRDILKEVSLPSAEAAYGLVKREATRLKIMPAANSESPTGATNDGHHQDKWASDSPPKINNNTSAQPNNHRESPHNRPTTEEDSKLTNRNYGVHTAVKGNIPMKLASYSLGFQNGRMRTRKQRLDWL